ncbi:MAG TPA: RNA-binding protein [Candidatus Cloacimonas sp.]|jgi:ribosome-associated heat shock protein Hsp15|nr:hypothetical protein [Candidatus Cloacimonadota bacterium]HCX73189.1 RNA-binding protein [Candidatus Cloacimonas sp.]
MRIDKLMNKLCLVKTRTIAKKACDKNLVKINDKVAKTSTKVSAGDVIDYELYGYKNRLKITRVPKGNVSKEQAPEYYEVLERQKLEV